MTHLRTPHTFILTCICIFSLALFISTTKSLPASPGTTIPQHVLVDVSANVEGLPTLEGRVLGTAWADYDNDGYQDLYLAVNGENKLYRNRQDGTFEDVSAVAGVNDTSCSVAATWGDVNNDGWLDIYISNERDERNKLYLNQGDGTFSEISASAGVDDAHFAQGGAWADYDGDRDLDFFLLQDDVENRFFRNNGDLTFTDVAPQLSMDDPEAAYGIQWGDFDNDNDQDLFLTNCKGNTGKTWINLLYRNNGDGTFNEIGAAAGVDYFGKSQGAIWLDIDNDLDLDLLVVNSDASESLILYENQNGQFTDITQQAGLFNFGQPYAPTSGDYDNDGDVDFLVVGFNPSKKFFENQGDGTFADASDLVQFPDPDTPFFNTASTADYDNDGFLDLIIGDQRGVGYLFHNKPAPQNAGNNWLILKMRGTESNPFGVGAKAIAINDDLRQMRYVSAGMGIYSQDMLPLHFGFGDRTSVDSLLIFWPSGVKDTLLNVATNQIITLVEDNPVPVELSLFEAKLLPDRVVLNWRTETEVNNFGFEVQRSFDKQTFGVIGFVKGRGSTVQPCIYRFEDRDLNSGMVYYRLKQIDTDGAFEFSATISVTITTPHQFELRQNYPNPFNPGTSITFKLPLLHSGPAEPQQAQLIIYDMQGREVKQLVNKKMRPGTYTQTWDGRNTDGKIVASGLYIYKLQYGEFSQTRKMIFTK